MIAVIERNEEISRKRTRNGKTVRSLKKRLSRALRKFGLSVVAGRTDGDNVVSGNSAGRCDGYEVNLSLGHLILLIVRRDIRGLVGVGLIKSGLKRVVVVGGCVVLAVVLMRIGLAGIAFHVRHQLSSLNTAATSKTINFS